MITCIRCRQKHSDPDHVCLEEMSLDEVMHVPEAVQEWVKMMVDKSLAEANALAESLFLDTATGEELDRIAREWDPPDWKPPEHHWCRSVLPSDDDLM